MNRLFIFALSLSVLISCKKDEAEDNSVPIVFVHGYFGSGDSYEWMSQRFTSNGFSSSRIFTFDWNTVLPDAEKNTVPLKHFIEKVLKQRVHLKSSLWAIRWEEVWSIIFVKILLMQQWLKTWF